MWFRRVGVKGTCRYDLDALGCEVLCSWLGCIAGDGANLELLGESRVVEDGPDDGATLVASGAEDGQELGHDEECWWLMIDEECRWLMIDGEN
jgi:hypothetical protein